MAEHIVGLLFALVMAGFGLWNCHENNPFVWGFFAFVGGVVAGLRLMRLITHKY